MPTWKPSGSVEQTDYYDWFLHKDLLVKIYHTGKYLTLFDEKKIPDNAVPHIEILLEGATEEGNFYYTHATMRIYSPKKNRPSLVMTMWKSGLQPKSLSPDILINLAKMQLDEAADTLSNVKNLFRLAKERVKKARAFPTVFSKREEYEKACKLLNVPIFSDELCHSYRIQFGEFKFPDYSADQCLTLKLARRRLRGILQGKDNAEAAKIHVVKGQQQWEPCKICGNEPRYLPLMACEKCWPR